jgi:hypothetical protein
MFGGARVARIILFARGAAVEALWKPGCLTKSLGSSQDCVDLAFPRRNNPSKK